MAIRSHPRLTYADYVRFPDDGVRRELIDGEIAVTPAPSVRHQRIVLKLARLLSDYLDSHGGGEVFIAPCDVLLSEHDVVQPDVIFVGEADARIVTEPNIKGVPTLLVEVLSDPATDRKRKRELYARAGVREYWIVDTDADRVEVYRLEERLYRTPRLVEPGSAITSPLLPGLTLDVAQILLPHSFAG